jgi:hypothetical protein
MIRLLAACLGALVFLFVSTTADARQRHRVIVADPGCNVIFPCEGVTSSARGEMIARAVGFGAAQKVYRPRASAPPISGPGGIVALLAAKTSEIQSACGSRIISGLRHSYIAGTRHLSLHTSGKAVDIAGNPGCIYAHLAGWQGGYSTDYARMAHVHISWDPDGGREMGLRFRHGGGRHFAHRHHRRYARA